MNATHAHNNQTNLSEILGTFLRLGTSASLGLLVTAMLLFLMCSLIVMDLPDIETKIIKITKIVMNDDRVIENLPEPMTPKPVDPQPAPQIPELTYSFENTEGTKLTMAPPVNPAGVDVVSGFYSGSAIAVLKVAPQYPRRLQTRGIEGFVDLVFDITPTGKTENIRVLFSEPDGAFEKSSIKALAKWKYKPAMDDGVAKAQKNQTTRISYELEK